MEIRKAQEGDFSRILEIYAHARAFMAENGNPRQWGATGWPPAALIQDDIVRGKCHVCTDAGRVIGVFFYDYGTHVDPCYDTIDGAWRGGETYGVVHRIASDGSQRGVGAHCIAWAFARCGHLRMDTHGDNVVMQGLLAKLGFVRCGVIHVQEDDEPRIAYEKLV